MCGSGIVMLHAVWLSHGVLMHLQVEYCCGGVASSRV